jgi:hypothetical protein
MLTMGQVQDDFGLLNNAARQSLSGVFTGLDVESRLIDLPASRSMHFTPLPDNTIARVESGLVSVVHERSVVSVLEPGDLVLGDSGLVPASVTALEFGSEEGATVRTWEQASFLNAISSDAARQKLWLTALIQTQSLMYRLTGLGIDRQAGLRGDTEVYSPGAVIIQQGDPADDVFSMVAGVAQVLVDEQPVARIATGELFGTMAALTNGHRNATVTALERCSVLRVPKDRFFEIIRTRPEAVQGLLVDMARSITALNGEVVTLRHRLSQP